MTASAVTLLVAGSYVLGVVRWRSGGRPWPTRRTASWVVGTLLLALALSPPLAAASQEDPRAHMVQHLVLGMYAPLALVLAAPVTLLLGAGGPVARRRVAAVLHSRAARGLTHPAVVVTLSAGGLWSVYLTPLHLHMLQTPWVHHLVNLHFVLSGALLAWAVAGPDPGPRRLSVPGRAGVLLVTAASHAVLAKVLYARSAGWPTHGAAHGDETAWQAAAEIMYYGGDVAEVLLAAALAAVWLRHRSHEHRRSVVRGGPAVR